MNPTNPYNPEIQTECYNILVRLFGEPEAGIHDNRKLYNKLIKLTGYLKPKVLLLAKKLRKTTGSSGIEDMVTEYRRLFGNHDKTLASPYSEYYIPKHENGTDTRVWVRDFYNKSGFNFAPEMAGPCHIITELMFIEYLLDQVSTGFRHDNMSVVNHFGDLRCRFINEHMNRWIPEFTGCILNHSKSPYYLQLAILLRTLIISCSGDRELNFKITPD